MNYLSTGAKGQPQYHGRHSIGVHIDIAWDEGRVRLFIASLSTESGRAHPFEVITDLAGKHGRKAMRSSNLRLKILRMERNWRGECLESFKTLEEQIEGARKLLLTLSGVSESWKEYIHVF